MRPHPPSRKRDGGGMSEIAVTALVAERARFHRFLTRRLGSATEADDVLQEALLRALRHGAELRRGENVVPWFFRILRNAVVDHVRRSAARRRKAERLLDEVAEAEAVPPAWDSAVCTCFEGLLPALKPRYAEILRRVDLMGESREAVARDLKLSARTLAVALHRARTALRHQLEVFCGACSREHCLTCACPKTGRLVRKV